MLSPRLWNKNGFQSKNILFPIRQVLTTGFERFPSFVHWPARLTKIQNVCFRPVIEFTFGYAIQVTSEYHVKFHAKNGYRTNREANFSIEPGFELWPLWQRCSAPPVKLSGLLGAGLYVALSGPVEGSHHSLWNNWNSRCFSVFSRFWNIYLHIMAFLQTDLFLVYLFFCERKAGIKWSCMLLLIGSCIYFMLVKFIFLSRYSVQCVFWRSDEW